MSRAGPVGKVACIQTEDRRFGHRGVHSNGYTGLRYAELRNAVRYNRMEMENPFRYGEVVSGEYFTHGSMELAGP